jgi:hypothetical protein
MSPILFFSITSAVLLFGFIITGIIRFGFLNSYSGYSSKWGEAVPMNNMNLWSIVTIVAAFLIMPGLLEVGALSMWQFLGFLVPVYLIVVALTPDWMTDQGQRKVHVSFALLCMLCGLTWIFLVAKTPLIFSTLLVFILTLGLLSGTLKRALIFWIELLLFLSVYLVVILLLL